MTIERYRQKRALSALLFAMLFLLPAAVFTAPEIIYAQGFANNSGSGKPLRDYDWKVYTRTNALDETATSNRIVINNAAAMANVNAAAPYGDGIVEGFYNANSHHISLSYTPLVISNLMNITVQFDMRNTLDVSTTRIAIEAGGQWYVSANEFNWTHATQFSTVSLRLDEAEFLPLNFSAGSELALPANAAPVAFSALGGHITAAGFFLEPNNGSSSTQMRVDNFTVSAEVIPIQSSLFFTILSPPALWERVYVYGDALLSSPEFCDALTSAGMRAVRLSADRLNTFSIHSARTVVLAPETVCPPESRPALTQFLRNGGNIAVIGAGAFDYRPVPANPVPLWRASTGATITYPPQIGTMKCDKPARSEITAPDGEKALHFETTSRGMTNVLATFSVSPSLLNSNRTVLTFLAKGSTYAELLWLQITDHSNGTWIHFLPVTPEWKTHIVSLADFIPEGWSDALTPYPLLNPENISKISIGINNAVVWREKPMAFSIGSIDLAENAAGIYAPTSVQLKYRIPYLELGITAPEWIFDPFAGCAAPENNVSITAAPDSGGLAAGTDAGISVAWICPPPYLEHPGTQMGTDTASEYNTKEKRRMRRIPLWNGTAGNSGAPAAPVAELRFFAAGELFGAGVALFGFTPDEFTEKPALISSLASSLHYALFTPKILSVIPNTTSAAETSVPKVKVTLHNPTTNIIRGTLSANAGAGRVSGAMSMDIPRRNKATRELELDAVPADFPFTAFDWEAVYEWTSGSDRFADHVDAERTLLYAIRHMIQIQAAHDDGRLTHHYFGDAYGSRAMFLYLEWLRRNPAQLAENADLWYGISTNAIDVTARRFTQMMLDRQTSSGTAKGAVPIGYGEYNMPYFNSADGGNITLALAQAASRMSDAALREEIYTFTGRLLDLVETLYTGNGLYRTGLRGGVPTQATLWYVMPDVMGAQAIYALEKNSATYSNLFARNTRLFIELEYSADSYFQAEALCWAYLIFKESDPELSTAVSDCLRQTFLPGMTSGGETHFYNMGGRGSLRALPLLYYQQLIENSAGSRAALLKYLWGAGSESSNVSVRRQAELHPRPRHGESIAAAKLAEYTSVWLMELLDPGSTLLPRFDAVMQPGQN
ncbi:MAG: hypothetical protein WC959_07070 [Kiritimatiellales bacterium]